MRYCVISNNATQQEQWETTRKDQGFDVFDEYEPGAIIVTLGGDGTILYATRAISDPTNLPVRTSGSKGYKTQLDIDQLVQTLDRSNLVTKGIPPRA